MFKFTVNNAHVSEHFTRLEMHTFCNRGYTGVTKVTERHRSHGLTFGATAPPPPFQSFERDSSFNRPLQVQDSKLQLSIQSINSSLHAAAARIRGPTPLLHIHSVSVHTPRALNLLLCTQCTAPRHRCLNHYRMSVVSAHRQPSSDSSLSLATTTSSFLCKK